MINGVILQIASYFLERQIAKFGDGVDWSLIKVDIEKRISDLVPGTAFDGVAKFLVSILIDLVAELFKQSGAVKVDKVSEYVNSANRALAYELTKRAMKTA